MKFYAAAARIASILLLGASTFIARPLHAEDRTAASKLSVEVSDALRQTVSSIAITGERLRFCAAQVTARENQLRDILVKATEAKAKWNDFQRQVDVANAKLSALRRVPANLPQANELRRELQALQVSMRDYGQLGDRLREEDQQAKADLRQQQECTRTNQELLKTLAAQKGSPVVAPK